MFEWQSLLSDNYAIWGGIAGIIIFFFFIIILKAIIRFFMPHAAEKIRK